MLVSCREQWSDGGKTWLVALMILGVVACSEPNDGGTGGRGRGGAEEMPIGGDTGATGAGGVHSGASGGISGSGGVGAGGGGATGGGGGAPNSGGGGGQAQPANGGGGVGASAGVGGANGGVRGDGGVGGVTGANGGGGSPAFGGAGGHAQPPGSGGTIGSGGGAAGAAGGTAGGGGLGGTGGTLILYGLTAGSYCFDIVGTTGINDGCGTAPGAVHMQPLTYTAAVGMVSLGPEGSFGQGAVSNNVGTLLRDGQTASGNAPACFWRQRDTTVFTLTANNTFTAAITETRDTFASACGAAGTPAGGTCTSAWTWTMKIHTPGTMPNALGSCQ